MTQPIDLEIEVERLARDFPESVGFLTRNGIRCIRCGEPVWGTLGQLLLDEGIENPARLVEEMNRFIEDQRK